MTEASRHATSELARELSRHKNAVAQRMRGNPTGSALSNLCGETRSVRSEIPARRKNN